MLALPGTESQPHGGSHVWSGEGAVREALAQQRSLTLGRMTASQAFNDQWLDGGREGEREGIRERWRGREKKG